MRPQGLGTYALKGRRKACGPVRGSPLCCSHSTLRRDIFNSYLLNIRVHFYHATSVPQGDCQLRDLLIFKLYLVIFVSI